MATCPDVVVPGSGNIALLAEPLVVWPVCAPISKRGVGWLGMLSMPLELITTVPKSSPPRAPTALAGALKTGGGGASAIDIEAGRSGMAVGLLGIKGADGGAEAICEETDGLVGAIAAGGATGAAITGMVG